MEASVSLRARQAKRRAQVSVELIIIIAAVLAVVLILVVQLQKTATKGSEMMEKQGDSAMRQVGSMITCENDEDCPGGFACNADAKRCEALA